MSRDYAAEVRPLLVSFLHEGKDDGLREYLAANSRLPGPRANLELANAFAKAVVLTGEMAKAVWRMCAAWTDASPKDAPSNDPGEFVVFCGARGIGALGATSPARAREALLHLRRVARDPRWRVREATAMAIQDLVEGQTDAALRALEDWIAPGAWREMRAVAAGLAEPRLLRERRIAKAALRIHERIVSLFRKQKDRSSDEYQTLRQCLAFSASVVVAAAPEEGFRWMSKLAVTKDPDVEWILRENLKKGRLIGPHHAQVERLQATLRHG